MKHKSMMSVVILCASTLIAQQPQRGSAKKPFQAQSSSTITYKVEDHSDVVEITNVDHELVGPGIPGRARDERLVLRKTTHTRQVVDDIGIEATTTVEAWPLGVDLRQKPLYSITVPGVDPKALNSDVIIISRGLEEVDWWSVYKLGNGDHLFDTYLPVEHFSIRRDEGVIRYAGLEVPPDDTSDARLKSPNVVAVLIYASADHVIREALVTCDDPKRAALLRSFADSARTIAFAGGTIKISISQNYPSPPATVAIAVPVAKDDLDIAHGQAPVGLHLAAFKR